jgi:hypothetical protein
MISRIISIFIHNIAVICLYYTIAVIIIFTWQDLGCVLALGCKADDTTGALYLTIGRILVFMHLWMMFLFVNAGFLKNREIDSSRLVVPVISSTALGVLTYLAAHVIVTLLIFFILWGRELWTRELWVVDLWLQAIF